MAASAGKKTPLSDLAIEERLLNALRRRKGRATLGDLVVDTGLPAADAERGLKALLRERQSHLEVDEGGEILYLFEPSLQRRGQGQEVRRALRAVGRWSWKAFKFLFKIAIMATLVIYFILFVVLIIAAFVAMASRSDSDSGGGSSSSSRRGGGLPIFWITHLFYVPPEPSYGRGVHHQPAEKKEPLYKRVFAYVFGPEANDDDPADPLQQEREVLAFIRSRKGLVTTPEVMAFTGWDKKTAEDQLGRLMGAFDGDVRVTPQGTLLYTFEKVAISAGEEGTQRVDLRPSWDRPEPKRELTGNTTGTNLLITFINAFNMFGAVIAPFFIMPLLKAKWGIDLGGPLGYAALTVFPLLFSLVFFAVPVLRMPWVWMDNARRAARNAWRFTLAEIYGRTARREDVYEGEVVRSIARSWPKEAAGEPDEPRDRMTFRRAVKELEPEIQSAPSGEIFYQFKNLAREQREGERARGLIDPAQLRLGKIVFSTADPDLGLDQLDRFEQELAPKEADPRRLRQLDPELDAFDAAARAAAPVDDAAQAALDDFERRLQAEAEAEAPASARQGGRR